MSKEQRPVTLIVHQPGACPLIKAGEGFALRGTDLTNPRGGKLCAQAICSVFPQVQSTLRELAPNAPLPGDLFPCSSPGCNATFKMEVPTPIDQSGMFTTPMMRRKSDHVQPPEREAKKKLMPFLKRLTLDMNDELHFIGVEKKYADGTSLLQQGVVATQLLILTHGMASLVVKRDGEEALIGSVGEGDFFGEFSLLTGMASDFEVRTVGECTVLAINQKEFYSLVLKRPALFQIVSKMVSEKFKAVAVTVENELNRGILGKLSMIPLADLVQTLNQSRRTGTLVIHNPTDQAFIIFLNGAVVSAVCGKKRGEEAFYRVLGWQDGEFCFEPGEVFELDAERDGAVVLDTIGLMMEGMRRLDEARAKSFKTPTVKL
ncbi:MAG: DUF4388 domain-containing protein [Planctomycetota bacterium]